MYWQNYDAWKLETPPENDDTDSEINYKEMEERITNPITEDKTSIENILKESKEKIKSLLFDLAEKRGLKEGVRYLSPGMGGERIVEGPLYVSEDDELCCANGDMLTRDGEWATVIEDQSILDTIIEITLAEIAELKGVSPSQIKIVP